MKSTQPIRDYVFPLIKGKRKDNEIEAGELIGTGFLIGKDGFAITAAHVIEQLLDGNSEEDVIIGLSVVNDKWIPIYIESYEKHDSDVNSHIIPQ